MRSLFLIEAKIVATGTTPTGEIVIRVMTLEEYITRNKLVLKRMLFLKNKFVER